MAWYDSITAGMVAIGGAMTVLITGLVQQLLKARRDLARHNSEIKVEKGETKAAGWVMDQMVDAVNRADMRAERAEAARDATMRAAKELLDQREIHVEKIARTEEKLANALNHGQVCEDRLQRAETRAAVAEEHMRKQAEQILVQSMTIDRLTTELSKHDKEAADRLTPVPRHQPLLMPDEGEHSDEPHHD